MIIILVCRITGTSGDCLPAPTAPACYYSITQDKESKEFLHKFLDDNDNRSHFMQRPSPVVVSPVTGACRPFDMYIVPPGGAAVNTFQKIFLTWCANRCNLAGPAWQDLTDQVGLCYRIGNN